MADTSVLRAGGTAPSSIMAVRGLPILLAATIVCALVQPRALPVLVALLALCLAASAWSWRHSVPPALPEADLKCLPMRLWQTQPATAVFLVYAVYSAATAIWSPSAAATLNKVAWLVVLVLTAAVSVRIWRTIEYGLRTRLLVAVAVSIVLGASFVAHEVLRDQAITRFLFSNVPLLYPKPSKHVTLEDGIVTFIGPWVMNRNVGALNLLMWPALLCIAALGWSWGQGRRRSYLLAAAVFIATLLATMPSRHESSQIAIVLSTVVFVIARLHLPAARAIVLAGWLAATLTMLPVAVLAHKAGLHESRLLPDTGQARIILWNFTAGKYLERPLLGVGAHATRAIDDSLPPEAKAVKGTAAYAERTGQHSHNFFVQTWFELGAVGALLYMACGLLLWREIGRLPVRGQCYALAGSTSAMCIAATTWGLWQEWYLSLFMLAISLTALASTAADPPGDQPA